MDRRNELQKARSAYQWAHEQCIYVVRSAETANWKVDRKHRTVWAADTPLLKDWSHPTQKPIELYTRPILNHSDLGDVVYDPFAGSGVVFAAAQETGRVVLGVEIEPHFCGRIIERLKGQYEVAPFIRTVCIINV